MLAGTDIGADQRHQRRAEAEDERNQQIFQPRRDGVDTRALQHYLGHRNITHTVRYTELRSDRFDGFWKD